MNIRDFQTIHDEPNELLKITRRTLFKQLGYGIGSIALTSMLSELSMAQAGRQGIPHFAPKAKRIIYLFMAGAPSQVDLFDPKPTLVKHNGEPIPEEIIKGERFAFIKGKPKLLGSPFKFEKVGANGQWVSELLPHFKEIADDCLVMRGIHTDQFNHAPAQIFMNTGFQLPGRPSMGSWLTYGLGTENRDLPGFVVLISGENNPDGGKACWGSGFLPTNYQGVEFRSGGDPILFLKNPDGVPDEARRAALDAIGQVNQEQASIALDPETETRIAQYELAYRMQSSAPELMDVSKESQATHEMYGTEPGKKSFANNCLVARRMIERGVRFVQVYHRGWDHHGNGDGNDLKNGLPRLCRETDKAAAALVKDLKQRGLLDETLVVWGGEFGRTPMNEERGGSPFLGRDHHPKAFTMWMAGGGVRPGSYGETDDLGYSVVEGGVHVHDLHATIMHLMGIDHTRLTYRSQGRDFRLTDVKGTVLRALIQ